ncbi:hypothetical protein B0H12DRAFT_239523 [Mycena haematopus]|nr:hypothetical protein B0H12DRAFT_239523 [Mycena haematopus]
MRTSQSHPIALVIPNAALASVVGLSDPSVRVGPFRTRTHPCARTSPPSSPPFPPSSPRTPPPCARRARPKARGGGVVPRIHLSGARSP